MKKILIFLLLIAVACSSKIDERILGTWQVKSRYHQATYKIEKQGKKLVGKLLYYNDNIKVLEATNTDKDIFLKDLKNKNDVYVDAISGATITGKKNIEIRIKSNDTLAVTRYIMNQPLKEFWTRKK